MVGRAALAGIPSSEDEVAGSSAVPWQASARAAAQRVGLDPRYARRLRWIRKTQAVRRSGARLRDHAAWILTAPEPDNFTYDIGNLDALSNWVVAVTGCPQALAERYVAEPAADAVLRERLGAATAGHFWWSQRYPPFGKRVGWYAILRALKPRLVLETGAHDGLGSLLLLRALELNAGAAERGRLVSFDINPNAGWLVGADPFWELRIQSSTDGLAEVLANDAEVGVFVYDGWHEFAAELADHSVVVDHLAVGGVLLTDDAQVSRALTVVADRAGLDYHEFQELPVNHFYPGAVLAAARRHA